MKDSKLTKFSYLILLLPIMVFLFGYTKIYISLPANILLFLAFLKVTKSNKCSDLIISKKNLLILSAIILIIIVTSGVGGMFYQSNDHHWRNAIFRDLINFSWPVQYESMGTTLVYYISIWMIPALFGKIGLLISVDFAWALANITLLIWVSALLLLTILQLIKICKLKKFKNILLGVFFFLFFSGLDYIGAKFYYPELFSNPIHLEWWAIDYQYSSMITQLFWVFNQAIVPWLITLIFLQEKDVKNYMILILLCLPYGPLPFLGMVPIFLVKGIEFLIEKIKSKRTISFLKDVFSLQNVISFIVILPIFYFYYSSNASLNGAGFRFVPSLFIGKEIKLITFWVLEFGLYWILLLKSNYKQPLFWTIGISLLLMPLFKVGYSTDFVMRASIPSLVVLIYYFVKEIIYGKNKIIKSLLILLFIVGLATPYYEYKRAITTINEEKRINCVADDIKTISDKNYEEFKNFVSISYEDSFFYKYIARK